jgi:hypothetical protein
MAGAGKKSGRKPPTQWPFPRAETRKVTAPSYDPGDSFDDARRKWEEWRSSIARLRQMNIPARSGGKKLS